ncbi:hypothetical protein [Kitasatospora phosalacinea]|uniref:hypothetical protein n=1 Tax=Kitasatospora phosalacinea TaxID=2065 RepID=UPI002D2198BC|nr:hypothetical protein [Kitasatospora phosalacinea]
MNDVDLDVADGEFIVLIGGLGRASAGRVEVLGTDLAGLSEVHLSYLRMVSIGFVFQELNLLPELTLQENVALPLEGRGWFVPRPAAGPMRRLRGSACRGSARVFPTRCRGPAAARRDGPGRGG